MMLGRIEIFEAGTAQKSCLRRFIDNLSSNRLSLFGRPETKRHVFLDIVCHLLGQSTIEKNLIIIYHFQ